MEKTNDNFYYGLKEIPNTKKISKDKIEVTYELKKTYVKSPNNNL